MGGEELVVTELVGGDLSAPETLDDALDGVGAVFLVWVAPLAPAARTIQRIASGPSHAATAAPTEAAMAWLARVATRMPRMIGTGLR